MMNFAAFHRHRVVPRVDYFCENGIEVLCMYRYQVQSGAVAREHLHLALNLFYQISTLLFGNESDVNFDVLYMDRS